MRFGLSVDVKMYMGLNTRPLLFHFLQRDYLFIHPFVSFRARPTTVVKTMVGKVCTH